MTTKIASKQVLQEMLAKRKSKLLDLQKKPGKATQGITRQLSENHSAVFQKLILQSQPVMKSLYVKRLHFKNPVPFSA